MIDWLIAFLGLPVGYILASMAKEELKTGIKYILLLKDVLYYSTIIVAFFFIKNYYFSILFIGFIAFYYYLDSKYKDYGVYLILLSLVFIVRPNSLVPSLIFMYGLPVGSMIFYDKKRS